MEPLEIGSIYLYSFMALLTPEVLIRPAISFPQPVLCRRQLHAIWTLIDTLLFNLVAVLPQPLVHRTFIVAQDSIPVHLVIPPFSFINVSSVQLHDAVAFPVIVGEMTLITISVRVGHDTISLLLTQEYIIYFSTLKRSQE